MKTDRELLELAARAYGLGKEWFYCEHRNGGAGMYRVDGSSLSYWSSEKDGGDALRLAVGLCFSIVQYQHSVEILIGDELIHRELSAAPQRRCS